MSILDNPAFKDPQVQMQFIIVFVESLIALWVVNDARTRGKSSRHAYLWGLGTLLAFLIVLPMWFLMRPRTALSPTSSTQTAPEQFSTAPQTETPSERARICDSCGKFYKGNFSNCPHCNAVLEK